MKDKIKRTYITIGEPFSIDEVYSKDTFSIDYLNWSGTADERGWDSNYICLETEKNELALVTLNYLQIQYISDWELLNILAILNFEKPEIEIKFYNVGEYYSSSNKVLLENRVLSKIKFFHKDQTYNLNDYLNIVRNDYNPNKIEKALSLLNSNERERKAIQIQNDELSMRKANKNDEFNDSYYNDQLDMDQQSPEFWDSQ